MNPWFAITMGVVGLLLLIFAFRGGRKRESVARLSPEAVTLAAIPEALAVHAAVTYVISRNRVASVRELSKADLAFLMEHVILAHDAMLVRAQAAIGDVARLELELSDAVGRLERLEAKTLDEPRVLMLVLGAIALLLAILGGVTSLLDTLAP